MNKTTSASGAVLVALLFLAASCGDSEKRKCHDPYLFQLGSICDSTVAECDECVSPATCVKSGCTDGTSNPQSCPSELQTGACTISCGGDQDCASMPTTLVADSLGAYWAISWSCVSGHCYGIYDFHASGSGCSGCGGALCAGRCIGCPGC